MESQTTDKKKFWKKVACWSAVVSGLIILPMSFGPITGLGPWAAAGSELYLFLIPFILVIDIFVCLARGALTENTTQQEQATEELKIVCMLIVIFVLSVPASYQLRSFGFYLTSLRAEPVVEAVKRYEKDKGFPPKSVDILVPEYINKIPYGVPPLKMHIYPDGRWQLGATVSIGIMNWDAFIYESDQNYEDDSYERLGDWVYLHE